MSTATPPAHRGRPRGSTSGRRPPAGYPRISADLAAFLAGFIEGEASFLISKQARNTNHRCAFSLKVRADDKPLLVELAAATALGGLTAVAARTTSHRQAEWRITAKSDCLRLCEILDRYPLRGRKSTDYAIWSAAVLWWTGGRPTTTWRHRDWTPIAYLKQRLEQSRRYVNESPAIGPDVWSGFDGDWLGFFSGFVTAEGHLGIHRNGPRCFAPKAQIAVRADDLALLRELRKRVGVGRIYGDSGKSRTSPTAAWMVRDSEGLERIVEILDRCPPRGRRGREYRVWREAVVEYGSEKPRRQIQRRLAELRAALAAERTYRGN